MSATLVSSNTTIKSNGGSAAILFNLTFLQSHSFTTAANEYAVLNVLFGGNTGGTNLTISGNSFTLPINIQHQFYIPSGISVTINSGSNVQTVYSYVRFINTP